MTDQATTHPNSRGQAREAPEFYRYFFRGDLALAP